MCYLQELDGYAEKLLGKAAELETSKKTVEVCYCSLHPRRFLRFLQDVEESLTPSVMGQELEEKLEEGCARERDLYDSNKRLEEHISDLESRKRAPLYQKKQEEELRAANEKAQEADIRAQEAELKYKEAKVRMPPCPSHHPVHNAE